MKSIKNALIILLQEVKCECEYDKLGLSDVLTYECERCRAITALDKSSDGSEE